MNIKKFFILAALLGSLLLPSCKKDKEEEVVYKNSFSGSLNFELPPYVAPGDVYNLVPAGLSRTDDKTKGIAYTWNCAQLRIKDVKTRKEEDPLEKKGDLDITIIDSTGLLVMKCTASAEGFYSTSKTQNFVIVHPTKTLLVPDHPRKTRNFTDPRDGRNYQYTRIGEKDWMISNMAYGEKGISHLQCKAMDPVYGKYYTWDEARKACPDGWRLPGKEDWEGLFSQYAPDPENPMKKVSGKLMTKAQFNEEKLWMFWPEVKITNESGLTVLPAGYVQLAGNKEPQFIGNLSYATFWSDEELNDEQAAYYYFYEESPDVMKTKGYKNSFAASVRCVRDAR